MPGKINPVMVELMAVVAFQAIGADVVTAAAVQAGQLELNVMMPAIAWNVLHSAEILKNAIHALATKCVDGISAKEHRCRSYANASMSIAGVLNPHVGYAAAAEIAKESVRTRRPVAEITLDRKLMDKRTLHEILDPPRMTSPATPIRKGLRNAKRKKRKT